MTHLALDKDYSLLQNQPPTHAKISTFALRQGTHRPQNVLQHPLVAAIFDSPKTPSPAARRAFQGFAVKH
jgi:hypothetical protein